MGQSVDIFALAERCLTAASIEDKLAVTLQAKQLLEAGMLHFHDSASALPIEAVRWPEELRFVDPRRLPRRKPYSLTGRIALLHAIAHIEFSAIQLHWDNLQRFPAMPQKYYRDWLQVILEELNHFCLLRRRLNQLGADYGDLPVHGGLWQVAVDTCGDVLERMALVPRCMEARGLDVTPGMIDSLDRAGDGESAGILEKILADEVGHVALGSFWFKTLCQQRGVPVEPTYQRLLARHLSQSPRGPFNRMLRLQAGFSAAELDQLERQGGISP
ncbi:MAG TPA: ferritin-like domain-containing protein [Methylothermaceae bacterium]|nr:ferritin-like domain-containing protein [Methylothermaceae bacterium]